MPLNIEKKALANKRFITLRDHLVAADADEVTYQSLQQEHHDRRAAGRLGGEVRVETMLTSRDGICIAQTTTTVEVRPGDYERIMAEANRAYRCRRALRDVPILHIEMGG